MIKNYNDFLNENILNLLKGPSDEEIKKCFKNYELIFMDYIDLCIKNEWELPSNEEVKQYYLLDKVGNMLQFIEFLSDYDYIDVLKFVIEDNKNNNFLISKKWKRIKEQSNMTDEDFKQYAYSLRPSLLLTFSIQNDFYEGILYLYKNNPSELLITNPETFKKIKKILNISDDDVLNILRNITDPNTIMHLSSNIEFDEGIKLAVERGCDFKWNKKAHERYNLLKNI